jgi:hypothetical protein
LLKGGRQVTAVKNVAGPLNRKKVRRANLFWPAGQVVKTARA